MNSSILLQNPKSASDPRIKSGTRTIYLVIGVVILMILYGFYQLLFEAGTLQSFSLSIFGFIALALLFYARRVLRQGKINQAAYIIILTIAGMFEGTLAADPGNSWTVGFVVALVMSQIVGELMDRHQSTLGVLLAILAGGIITINDTLLMPKFSIEINETIIIGLVIGLFFMVRVMIMYHKFPLGAKFMLIIGGLVILSMAVIISITLIMINSMVDNHTITIQTLDGANNIMRMLLLAAGCCMMVSGIITWLVTRSIVAPFNQIVENVDAVSGSGDLSHKILIQSEDEFGALSGSFNRLLDEFQSISTQMQHVAAKNLAVSYQPRSKDDQLGNAFIQMAGNLKEIIQGLSGSIEELDSASIQLTKIVESSRQSSQHISYSMQDISKGSSQQNEAIDKTIHAAEQVSNAIIQVSQSAQAQASFIEQAVESTLQISNAIKQVAESAQTVSLEADKTADSARSGVETVQKTIQGMNLIKSKVGLSTLKVQEMGQRSDQIGLIVETIEDIASQTNLLALNAAIEAARAGEHGKGFAVVADEVRKLAERASSSTKEISELVKSIQTSVAEAVEAMQAGAIEVENGAGLTNQAGQALELILNAANAVASQSRETTVTTGHMISTSNELVEKMDQVSSVVEKYITATQEINTSSADVTQSIGSIAAISEENTKSVDKVSLTSGEIGAQIEDVANFSRNTAELAHSLRKIVAQFNL